MENTLINGNIAGLGKCTLNHVIVVRNPDGAPDQALLSLAKSRQADRKRRVQEPTRHISKDPDSLSAYRGLSRHLVQDRDALFAIDEAGRKILISVRL